MKKIVLPTLTLCALTAGVFAMSNVKVLSQNDDDKKCTVKIIKNIDGVETIIDSTFNCNDSLVWNSLMGEHNIEIIHQEEGGGNIQKEIEIVMIDEDGSHAEIEDMMKNLNIHIDGLEGEHKAISVMMLDAEGEGKELGELMKHIEIKCNPGEDGDKTMKTMKFIDNQGNETELKEGAIEWTSEEEDVFVNINENGEGNEVKIIKKKDADGNETVTKWVNGEEVEVSESGEHNVFMFTPEGGTEHTMDVNIEVLTDGGTKRVVIVKNITASNKSEIENSAPEAAAKISKEELKIDALKFGPNPNNGNFNLSFKSGDNSPLDIEIYDMQGKRVFKDRVKQFDGSYNKNVDISDNGKGTYVLQITQNQKTKTRKVVVK